MSDLDAAIRAKLSPVYDPPWAMKQYRAALLAALELHSGARHQCPAEVEGYTVMRWHGEGDPCPTARAIAKALGIEVSNV